MLVSLVIPVFSPPKWVSRLAASCESQGAVIRLHLFLHSDTLLARQACDAIASRRDVTLHPFGHNRGLSRTWNDGMLLGYAEGADVVVIANDDVAFAPGDLDRLAAAAVAERDRYIFTCRGFHGYLQRHSASHGYSCFAVNPIALERIGCFDENIFPAYCEDQDYSRRAALAGLREGNCPQTDVFHAGSTAIHSSGTLRMRNELTQDLNKSYYRSKWGGDGDHERFAHPFDNPAIGYRIDPARRARPYGPPYDRHD